MRFPAKGWDLAVAGEALTPFIVGRWVGGEIRVGVVGRTGGSFGSGI
jgi:hypothetical protein